MCQDERGGIKESERGRERRRAGVGERSHCSVGIFTARVTISKTLRVALPVTPAGKAGGDQVVGS